VLGTWLKWCLPTSVKPWVQTPMPQKSAILSLYTIAGALTWRVYAIEEIWKPFQMVLLLFLFFVNKVLLEYCLAILLCTTYGCICQTIVQLMRQDITQGLQHPCSLSGPLWKKSDVTYARVPSWSNFQIL
jgi:hypothetical protein